MRISLIVAMAHNRVIGRDNALPWHLPGDLRHFREITMGKPMIMGRRTFESIGRPLPGRTSIVISSGSGFRAPPGVLQAASLDEALNLARDRALRDGVDECMVIGGAVVYEQCLQRAQRIYMTLLEQDAEGDTLFPPIDGAQWREVSRRAGFRTSNDEPEYWFVLFERIIRDVSQEK